jgi:hypothetical protein
MTDATVVLEHGGSSMLVLDSTDCELVTVIPLAREFSNPTAAPSLSTRGRYPPDA